MKFQLLGSRIVERKVDKEYLRHHITFKCEADVAGILTRMDHEAVHLRGIEGGRCVACGTKETYPWMDTKTQRAAWDTHPSRCNFAFASE